jgi:hypothetical protein
LWIGGRVCVCYYLVLIDLFYYFLIPSVVYILKSQTKIPKSEMQSLPACWGATTCIIYTGAFGTRGHSLLMRPTTLIAISISKLTIRAPALPIFVSDPQAEV